MNTTLAASPNISHSLYGTSFDSGFIIGIPAIAIVCVVVALLWPSTLWPIIGFDLWILGYQHVIATYTRTAFDRTSWKRYWPLMVLLPIAIAYVVLLIGTYGGLVALNTIYFYWLWFHYVRQSEGVSKAYASRCRERQIVNEPLLRLTFYTVPAIALLTLSSRPDRSLFGVDVITLLLPHTVIVSLWVFAGALLTICAGRLARAYFAGGVSREYIAYISSHYAIFSFAYGVMPNMMVAWLCLNIWHNLQYLSFVWLSHQRRFDGNLDPTAALLSTLAKPRNIWLYITVCITVAAAFYYGVENLLSLATLWGIPASLAAMIAYQTINFHHYIVDAIIWRRPRSPKRSAPATSAGNAVA